MPAPYVKQLAKKHDVSTQKAEKRWDAAKEQAEKNNRKDDYAYIMGIFKKMMGEQLESLSMTEVLVEFQIFVDLMEASCKYYNKKATIL